MKFDHEFIGREALEKIAGNPPRQKVTLVWNGDDVARVVQVALRRWRHHEVHRPAARELLHAAVRPCGAQRQDRGLSTYTGYIYNERAMLSLAMVENAHATPGTEVTLVWGEPGPRVIEADRGASHAGRDSRDGCTSADLGGGTRRVSAQVVGSKR